MNKILITLCVMLLTIPIALACGERDVTLVNDLQEENTVMKRSSCSSQLVNVDENNQVLVERDQIKVSQHTAQEVLHDYLQQTYGGEVQIVNDAHSDVKGHEDHGHVGGKLQDSHGTISYAFLVRGDNEFHNGKAIPLYVDAFTGVVYGVGCGYGAGPVVFEPNLNEYENFWTKVKHWVIK